MIRLYRLLKRANLRTKLLLGFLIVSLLPLSVLGIYSYTISSDSLRTQMENRVEDYAGRVALQINDTYDRYQEALDGIVYSDELLARVTALENGRLTAGELRLYLDSYLQTLQIISPAIRSLDVLFSGDLGLRYNQRTREAQLSAALATLPDGDAQLTDSGVLWFVAENDLCMVRTVPDLYSGRETARLFVTLDKRSFFNATFLADSPDVGVLIADSGQSNVISLVKNIMTTGVIPINFLRNATKNVISYNGVRYMFASAPLKVSGWSLYVITSYETVLEKTDSIMMFTFGAIFVCILLIAALSLMLSSNFARRIEFLIRQMKEVSRGNWMIETAVSDEDEIGQLSVAFEQMVEQLETLVHDVYESKIAQRESEFRALQTQINPHFLYNCLDNMNWYAIMRGDEHSSYMITQLSDFYRTALNRGKNTITVAEELKNATAYMNLQLELHDNNFRFETDIEEELGDYITINLMLQPLLENAIKHGVDKTRSPADERLIRLTVCRVEDTLHFEVFNTGSAISPEVLRSVFLEKTQGYGLRNVDERLRLLFGDDFGVHIRGVEKGTLCTIVIPLRLTTAAELPAAQPEDEEVV